MLRPYQEAAFKAAIDWIKTKTEPAVLELATGAGKSHVISSIAHWVQDNTGKKVLCLQPSRELTEQNHQKYELMGERAGLFSASVGRKETRFAVTYGTPGTVVNSMARFGSEFACIIIDEAHGITPTIQKIVAGIREKNPFVRVLGLSATPYRMMEGYIYQYDESGAWVDAARDPYFSKLLVRVTPWELIRQGYLTPAHADTTDDQYEGATLETDCKGQFVARQIERVFEGRGRKTSKIVADVVQRSAGRRGVMLFAATVQHAQEIMESLPPDNSRMIGGSISTGKSEREKLITDFKAMRFKYIVSVGILTTGFDAPHVDVIAVLRATESPGLFQQIIGRGLRLFEGKKDCLVLDYAENIERHGLDGDLFDPKIRPSGIKDPQDGEGIRAVCPECGFENHFSPRENLAGFDIDRHGYFIAADGERVTDEEVRDQPAHFGRRCNAMIDAGAGKVARCGYRWEGKECEECGHHNDIAARYCESCKAEIVDPNEKLRREFARIKKDPYAVSTDPVLDWSCSQSMSQKGNPVLVCEYKTEWRKFKAYFMPGPHPSAKRQWESLSAAVFSGHVAPSVEAFVKYVDRGRPPETVTYHRERGSQFNRVLAHNRPADTIEGAA